MPYDVQKTDEQWREELSPEEYAVLRQAGTERAFTGEYTDTETEGTVEAWGRSADNPVGGWYGQRKGYRGRFGMYLPPLLEALGLAELTHDARNNTMRAR